MLPMTFPNSFLKIIVANLTHATFFTEYYFNTNVDILFYAQTLFFRVHFKKKL